MTSFQLVLAAGAQRLSNGYGGASANNAINPAQDLSFRQIFLQAEGADAFVGQDALTTSTTWGLKVDSSDLQPVVIDGAPAGIKLSDFWVAGAGATIHVLGIPL